MLQKLVVLIISGLLFVAVLVAKDWEEKSSSEWTETNLWEILMDSAWVSKSSADFPGSTARGARLSDRAHLGLVINSLRYPMIRLLTAKPIRDAQAMRTIFMNPGISHVVSIQDLSEEFRQDDNEAGLARLQRFAKDHPRDIRVIGDPEYMVVSITMTQVTHCNFGSVRQQVNVSNRRIGSRIRCIRGYPARNPQAAVAST